MDWRWLQPSDPRFLGFVVLPAVLLFFQFGMRHVIGYRLTDVDVKIVLFGHLPVRRVASYGRIKEVRRADLMDYLIPAVRFNNRLDRLGVVILSQGRLLPVTLTPDDPDEFVRQVRRRVFQVTN